jgi:hypothetical protein
MKRVGEIFEGEIRISRDKTSEASWDAERKCNN